MNKSGRLVIISGPSGVGKTSLVDALISSNVLEVPCKKVVTYTTRSKRDHEKEGVDYYFISPAQFQIYIEEDFFIEWAHIYNQYYGIDKNLIDYISQGIWCFIVINQEGTTKLLKIFPDAVTIWIDPPHLKELAARLAKRGHTTHENPLEIATRLEKAANEIRSAHSSGIYKYWIINANFEETLKNIAKLLHFL
jgi:guanylate kinase